MTDHTYYKQLLSFTQLSVQEVDELLELGTSQSLPAHTLLTKPQQLVKDIYFFKTGIVRKFVVDKNGGEFTRNFTVAPNFITPSLTDFFLETASISFCEVLTEVEAIKWDYQTFMTFMEAHPKFHRAILKGIITAFRLKEEKEMALHFKSAEERYAQFLQTFPTLVSEVPLRHIASYLNMRRETLSRIRAKRNYVI